MKLELSYKEIKKIIKYLDEYSGILEEAAMEKSCESSCEAHKECINKMLRKAEDLTKLKRKVVYSQIKENVK